LKFWHRIIEEGWEIKDNAPSKTVLSLSLSLSLSYTYTPEKEKESYLEECSGLFLLL
jgi:hypothetical protein